MYSNIIYRIYNNVLICLHISIYKSMFVFCFFEYYLFVKLPLINCTYLYPLDYIIIIIDSLQLICYLYLFDLTVFYDDAIYIY